MWLCSRLDVVLWCCMFKWILDVHVLKGGEGTSLRKWMKGTRIMKLWLKFMSRHIRKRFTIPKGSMYGIFTYIWLMFMVNVGEYTIHGSYGIYNTTACVFFLTCFLFCGSIHTYGAFNFSCGWLKETFHSILEIPLWEWRRGGVCPAAMVWQTRHQKSLDHWKM